ncbi:hypothetical protein DY000_02024492 [Brassica cretica]|uniref:Uncharacterized protein n=1 Tax=Brassica cretica TaxID=69181 RepID=A0ABQ7DZE1_BRACR|nr:hypothetical protein DY000_02024492 [Brassica cretica]
MRPSTIEYQSTFSISRNLHHHLSLAVSWPSSSRWMKARDTNGTLSSLALYLKEQSSKDHV